MPPRTRSAFGRLEARLQNHFSGDLKVWWPATAGARTYTVPLTCRETDERGEERDLAATLSMATGSVTLHVLKASFPFPPEAGMFFMLGPSNGAPTPAYTAAAVKYEVTSVSGPEMFAHYTLQARRHGG